MEPLAPRPTRARRAPDVRRCPRSGVPRGARERRPRLRPRHALARAVSLAAAIGLGGASALTGCRITTAGQGVVEEEGTAGGGERQSAPERDVGSDDHTGEADVESVAIEVEARDAGAR